MFDAPSTVGFFDREEANLFSADCFGALLQQHVEFGDELPRVQLRQGMAFLAEATAPWLAMTDPERFEAAVEVVRELAPVTILSAHGPILRDLSAWACDEVSRLPELEPLPSVDDLHFRQLLDTARQAAA